MMTYVLSQFRGRPWRAFGVVAGVALGAALYVAIAVLGNGFREAARRPLEGVAADLIITRPAGPQEESPSTQRTRGLRLPFGSALISSADVGIIAHTDGVAAVAAALQLWDFGPDRYTIVLGVDPSQHTVGPGRTLMRGLMAGRAFRPGERDVAVADRHYAAFFTLKPGSTTTVGGKRLTVVGIAEQSEGSQAAAANLYVPLADAQILAEVGPGQVNQVYVRLVSAGNVDAVLADLARRLGQISAITEDSLLQVMGGIGRISARFTAVAAAVGLVGGVVLAWLALSGWVSERRQEIGLMKSLGWRAREVERVFLLEAMALTLFGGFLGIVLGMGSAWMLGRLPLPNAGASLTSGLVGLGSPMSPTGVARLPVRISLTTLCMGLLAAIGGGTLAGWITARQAATVKPAETFRQG